MLPLNINKRDLWRYVNIKIKRLIHHYHVFSVISILFEEMVKDLQDGKEIKIANFGTLILKDMPPRRHYDVVSKEISVSPGNKIIRFFSAKSFRKKLCDSIDLDKKNENN